MPKPKLRLAVTLPLFQTALAAFLLRLGGGYVPLRTPELLASGLNAPAFLFAKFLDSLLPGAVVGFAVHDLYFLVGTAILWYSVGRVLERRDKGRTESPGVGLDLVLSAIVLAAGVLLLPIAWSDLRSPAYAIWSHRIYRGIPTLAWAASLIFLSGRALLRSFRHPRVSV